MNAPGRTCIISAKSSPPVVGRRAGFTFPARRPARCPAPASKPFEEALGCCSKPFGLGAVPEDLPRSSLFHDLSAIHEDDPAGNVMHELHLVTDDQHGHPAFVRLTASENLHHLRVRIAPI